MSFRLAGDLRVFLPARTSVRCRPAPMATNFLTKIFGSRNDRLLKTYRKTVERINALEPEFEKLSDEALKAVVASYTLSPRACTRIVFWMVSKSRVTSRARESRTSTRRWNAASRRESVALTYPITPTRTLEVTLTVSSMISTIDWMLSPDRRARLRKVSAGSVGAAGSVVDMVSQ